MSSLPPTFTSLYRLLLRTASASVLHHQAAKINLRRLYRPTFEDAAQVVRRLEQKPGDPVLENWLKLWNERMDNTLALLYTSSQSRGLPHRLTRNLSLLSWGEYHRLSTELLPRWNSQRTPSHYEIPLPPNSEEGITKAQDQERWDAVDRCQWNAFSDVLRMAEGQGGLVFGTARIKGKIRVPSSQN
ncbi:hypothetical protein C8J56DRAFT_796553 [Mycena floridula]|nr:hypothetical protein C8J56DRAFT_796553 [Mycena floridula]